jgi:hypothetical protein
MPGLRTLCACLAAIVAMSSPVGSADDEPALKQFNERIAAYVAIHRRLVEAGPQMQPTSDPANVRASQQQLASRIRAVRFGAQQGDVLIADVARIIRTRLRAGIDGEGADDACRPIADATEDVLPVVNAPYYGDEAVASVPLRALAGLPALPPELEFRVTGTHLILRDLNAGMVVDYIADVMCPSSVGSPGRGPESSF